MTAQDVPENLPIPAPQGSVQAARADLEAFEDLMFKVLETWGLPTGNIIVAAKQRETLLKNTPDVIEAMTDDERARAPYIAKMIMAGSVGLFDAALNYLWNETVNRLRDHVAAFDVDYFFTLAETDPARRKTLKTREDLAQIDDYKLLEAANKIKLISDVGFKQLVHINYMRNHASAAHPNIEELTGLKLAEWLETCIKEVFHLKPQNVVASIGKLLSNIKDRRLSQDELKKAAAFFDGLPPEQSDNLAAALFGIYTPEEADPEVQDNVRSLWPDLWPLVSEEARNELGIKLARFTANADTKRAARARELLELVGGSSYLPEPERVAEIQQALDDLKRAHETYMRNFYDEPPAAERLKDVVGRHGDIPEQVTQSYVLRLVDVFLTNSYGVAWNAEPTYKELIGRFDGKQAALALRSFGNRAIRLKLQDDLPRKKWKELLKLIAPKLTGRGDRTFLEAVKGFTGTPDKLISDTKIKAQLDLWLDQNNH
ncbi:hypothetical protein OS965_24645 [Streptomyces sp. H27-G5]|uniref:hypothetical protein n=1 Tax=Streptomyces sp. H27-G5 TaxID=2996698 RepID=UPI0022712948|nr:hypothetical protein [Streptomyces sp. H27-G5]MCY0921341.1 hypothetical protein [Streptomyces sp. H27-G5]